MTHVIHATVGPTGLRRLSDLSLATRPPGFVRLCRGPLPLMCLGLLFLNCQTVPVELIPVPQNAAESLVPGTYEVDLAAAGYNWTYALHVPTQSGDGPASPLVVLLHGSGEDGATHLAFNGWIDKSESAGFVIAAPDALPLDPYQPPNLLTNPRFWNAEQPYLDARRRAVDDPVFFDALLDDIATRVNIDPDRVYLAGHSGGGGMVFRLAAQRSQIWAAVATLASPCFQVDPTPSRAVPTLFISGTLDPILPLGGGRLDYLWLHRDTPPVLDIIGKWAAVLGCDGEPVERREGALRILAFGGCSEEAPFTAILIEGHGHRWPGGSTPFFPESLVGPTTLELYATEVIWRFFEEAGRR